MTREQDELREVARHAQAQVDYMASRATGGGDTKARLISAAPEMLEALEAAIECGMVPKSSASEGGALRHSRQVQVADMIRAAIAKARGTT